MAQCLIMLEIARNAVVRELPEGVRSPACGSRDAAHRASVCTGCQDAYRVTNAKARAKKRREQRAQQVKEGLRPRSMQTPLCGRRVGPAEEGAYLSLDPDEHRPGACSECNRIAQANFRAKHRDEINQRRRTRRRAAREATKRPVPASTVLCAYPGCGRVATELAGHIGLRGVMSCTTHERTLHDELAAREAERIEPKPITIGERYQRALALLATLPEEEQRHIRQAAARGPAGITLAASSPLYRANLSALAHAAHARASAADTAPLL